MKKKVNLTKANAAILSILYAIDRIETYYRSKHKAFNAKSKIPIGLGVDVDILVAEFLYVGAFKTKVDFISRAKTVSDLYSFIQEISGKITASSVEDEVLCVEDINMEEAKKLFSPKLFEKFQIAVAYFIIAQHDWINSPNDPPHVKEKIEETLARLSAHIITAYMHAKANEPVKDDFIGIDECENILEQVISEEE